MDLPICHGGLLCEKELICTRRELLLGKECL